MDTRPHPSLGIFAFRFASGIANIRRGGGRKGGVGFFPCYESASIREKWTDAVGKWPCHVQPSVHCVGDDGEKAHLRRPVFPLEIGHLGDVLLHGVFRRFACVPTWLGQPTRRETLAFDAKSGETRTRTFLAVPGVPLGTSFGIEDVGFGCVVVVRKRPRGVSRCVHAIRRSKATFVRATGTHTCRSLPPWPA